MSNPSQVQFLDEYERLCRVTGWRIEVGRNPKLVATTGPGAQAHVDTLRQAILPTAKPATSKRRAAAASDDEAKPAKETGDGD